MNPELLHGEKGALPGRIPSGRPFRQADGGTLFLTKLAICRWMSRPPVTRWLTDSSTVGGYGARMRINAATHQKSRTTRSQGRKFREDLFHRLNVIFVSIFRRCVNAVRISSAPGAPFLQVAARELWARKPNYYIQKTKRR
ncbi:sigma 54-interacting transcriptional regulator [Salmonella enterica subsp. enterica]|nr:sigma 54-interacting transcriptional regulator [Salmonella enterica subsp. enterica]